MLVRSLRPKPRRSKDVHTRHRFYAAPARSADSLPDSHSEAMPREDTRVPVFTVAALAFVAGRDEPWPCTVRDLSRGGARLEFDRTAPPRRSEELPDHIILYFCPDRTEVQARVAWRDGRHFGVQFTCDIVASTRRAV
jgi:hypothetical protein